MGERQLAPLPLGWGQKGVKKVCIPLTWAQPQGQVKRELRPYLPTEPAAPGRAGREWDRFWECSGEESWLAELVATWQCQSPGLRAPQERRWTKKVGEHPRPVLGGLGLPEGPCRLGRPGQGAVKGA